MRIVLKFLNNGAVLNGTMITWRIVNPDGVQTHSGSSQTSNPGGVFQTDDTGLPSITPGSDFFYTVLGETKKLKLIGVGGSGLIQQTIRLSIAVGGPVAAAIPVGPERVNFTNPERLWLSYETRFNWPQFLKTNQKFPMNVYRVDASKLLIIFAEKDEGLDDATLTSIRDAFFPSVTSLSDLRALGLPPWKGPRAKLFASPLKSIGTRDTNIVRSVYAYMPYNSRDNKLDDRVVSDPKDRKEAIGTRKSSRKQKLAIVPFITKLDTWNTASRSSLVKLKLDRQITFKDKDDSPKTDDYAWSQYGAPDQPRFLDIPITPGGAFTISGADFYKTYFSLKTGVNIIGLEQQDSKAILEHNSILAALRSAYIREVESKFGYDSFTDPQILILTEIATVTEADPNWDKWMFPLRKDRSRLTKPEFGDGYQIRFLRGLKNTCEYFPPLSIPFIKVTGGKVDTASSCDFTKDTPLKYYSVSDFTEIDKPEWVGFWRKHFAEAIGIGKARLLLRYGLQGFGGNAQNFLLEMDDGVPNGRIVFRDMGDYALHDYVLWALFGPGKDGVPPPAYDGLRLDDQERLVSEWKSNLRSDLIRFECDDLHQYKDHGEVSEFPTFCGYHRPPKSEMHTFNPFCGSCATSDTKPNPQFVGHLSPLFSYLMLVTPNRYQWYQTNHDSATWGKIFAVQAEWGISCVWSWVKYFEAALGAKFKIDWYGYPIAEMSNFPRWPKTNNYAHFADRIFDPAEFSNPTCQPLWKEMYEKMKTWEMYVGMQVENYLKTAEGQKAVVAYKNRKWSRLTPTIKLRVSNASDQPMARYTLMMQHEEPSGSASSKWSELTDDQGIIEIFHGSADEYKVGAYANDGSTEVYVDLAEISRRGDRRADFGYLKVEYLA